MRRHALRHASFIVLAACLAGWGSATADGAASDNAQDVAPAPVASIDGEIARAQDLRAHGDYAGAVKAFAQIMLVAPDEPRVVAGYGKALVQQGRPSDAIPFLKRALELQPSDASSYSALGVAYDQLDQHALAKTAHEHAMELKPNDPAILNNYALSRMMAGDSAEARKAFGEAVALNPQNAKIAANEALLPAADKAPAAMPRPAPSVASHVAQAQVRNHMMALATQDGAASAMPRALPQPTVYREAVPVDPLAGPVHTKVAAARKPARERATHVAATPQPPLLRASSVAP